MFTLQLIKEWDGRPWDWRSENKDFSKPTLLTLTCNKAVRHYDKFQVGFATEIHLQISSLPSQTGNERAWSIFAVVLYCWHFLSAWLSLLNISQLHSLHSLICLFPNLARHFLPCKTWIMLKICFERAFDMVSDMVQHEHTPFYFMKIFIRVCLLGMRFSDESIHI